MRRDIPEAEFASVFLWDVPHHAFGRVTQALSGSADAPELVRFEFGSPDREVPPSGTGSDVFQSHARSPLRSRDWAAPQKDPPPRTQKYGYGAFLLGVNLRECDVM
jgi:hypothetical protein